VTKILVVDDELPIRRALAISLKAHGFTVEVAATGEEALRMAADRKPDLLVLDLGLPGIDGIEVIEGIRGWSNVPIVVLSARDQEPDKIRALDVGADDYVTKPFGMGELVARIRASLRRVAQIGESPEATVNTEHFIVDLLAKDVRIDGERVHLTPTEWGLLEVLVRNPGKLVTQHQILHDVWGPQYETESSYPRAYMASLRRKLEPEPSKPRYFLTEPGMGYRFQPDLVAGAGSR
jgi:two-component system KDP operon response regulator KdpE